MMKLDAFAITVYRKPEVADACLRLQQEIGLDVPVLLFCAWFSGARGELDDKLLEQVIERSLPFSMNVVRPLREARRWMKQPAELLNSFNTQGNQQPWQSLRETIKSIEISAELLWLDGLQSLAETQPLSADKADFSADKVLENMQRYCRNFTSAPDRDSLRVTQLLTHIAVACEQLLNSQADLSS